MRKKHGKCRLCGEPFTKKCPEHKICEHLEVIRLKKEKLAKESVPTKKTTPPTKPSKFKETLLPNKTCRQCNNPFYTSLESKLYCSKQCQKDYYKNNAKPKETESTRNRFIILKRDKFCCIYCGKSSIENSTELHVDHIYPVSKGGTDEAGNLITSCSECNLAKSNEILDLDILLRLKDEVKRRNADASIPDNLMIKWSASAENRK